MTKINPPKIALVTDWMTSFGGENKVLFALHTMFPEAPIFTTMYNPKELPMYKDAEIITSFLDRFPFTVFPKKKAQMFLPLMPLAFESFDFSDYDIVISSSHACSKGIITGVDTLHISYCHAPMRYAWEGCHQYINENAPLKFLGGKAISYKIMHKMRMWDRLAADRVDAFITNSHFIKRQVKKFYQRDAQVIYPPIETGNFHIDTHKEKYFLAGGRLIPNKKFELIVEAFNELGLPLKIFGKGPQLEFLAKKAKSNIEFLGFVDDKDVPKLFNKAQAFIVPQLEDFGIVTVESLASGTPVIGFGKGGTKELVTNGVTGILMEEQTVDNLIQKIKAFETMHFDSQKIRQSAMQYDIGTFKRNMTKFIDNAWQNHKESLLIN